MHRWLLALLFVAGAPAKAALCAADTPLRDGDMNPTQLQLWLDKNSSRVRTPGDLVCCLPEAYRRNYAVGHSSVALQRGTPDHPRVLLFEDVTRFDFQMILSVSSGDADSHGDSVEMVYQNPASGLNSFINLSFANGRKSLEKNPAVCLACHGESGAALGLAGPHLNFDITGDWPRFVGGSESCTRQRDADENLMAERAMTALRTQSTYRCLDSRPLREYAKNSDVSFLRSELFNLDFKLNTQNTKRLAYVLAAQKEYARFKFALIAKSLCEYRTQQLIPKPVLDKLSAQVVLTPGLGEAADPLAFTLQLNLARSLSEPRFTPIDPGTGMSISLNHAQACDRDAELYTHRLENLENDWEKRLSLDPTLRGSSPRIEVDNLLQLYFAASQLSYSGLSMTLIPDQLASSFGLMRSTARQLLSFENSNSGLRRLLASTPIGERPREETCESLRKLSLEAFQ